MVAGVPGYALTEINYWLWKDWDTIGIVYNKALLDKAGALTGSWLVHWYEENCKFAIGFAPLPKGPVGRKSVISMRFFSKEQTSRARSRPPISK
jgi:hypothetical protein